MAQANLNRINRNRELSVPVQLQPRVIPSLDGVRGVAILLVMAWHLRLSPDLPPFAVTATTVLFNGLLGVRIFFVLSGFLITTLLLKEKIKNGSILLRKFCLRRILRIFPVFYSYLLVLLVLNETVHTGVDRVSFLSAALYISNFSYQQVSWYTGHSWSLAVEEQYYLVWPFVLRLFPGRAMLTAAALILMVPLLRIAVHFVNHPLFINLSLFPFLDAADALFIGSFYAFACFKGMISWAALKQYRILIMLAGSVSCILMYYLLYKNTWRPVMIPFAPGVSAILIGLMILCAVANAGSAGFAFLNHGILKYTGKISYSLYVWQQLFIPGYFHNWLSRFPVNIAAAVAVASFSYYTIEKLSTVLKQRFNLQTVEYGGS